MTDSIKKFGLLGYPLSHTFSISYFKDFFDKSLIDWATYDSFPLETLEDLPDLLSVLSGLNVTIPYKELVLPYLDKISKEAENIGAVNCIKIQDGIKYGYNTDAYGFEVSLINLLEGYKPPKALILGTGGAAKAVEFVLNKLEIEATYVSRKIDYLNYTDLNKDIIDAHQLIINTTPLGMFPNIDICPEIPYDKISDRHFLFDLVYNPEKSLFLTHGEAEGAKIMNGYQMLILQAEKSWDIWTNHQTH
jgi:shikimate dehydrogenase